MERTRHRWRWVVALVIAHLVGCLGVLAVDLVCNRKMYEHLGGPDAAEMLRLAYRVPWVLIPWLWNAKTYPPDPPGFRAITCLAYLWPLVVLLVVYARTRPGIPYGSVRCRACGYDCRASLGRCPECGAIA